MKPLSPISTYYIHRTVFQSILHQALIHQAGKPFLGLLGCTDEHGCTLDKVALFKIISQSDAVFEQWNKEGIACVGVFHMQGESLPDALLDKLPDTYVRLGVKLDEKGRLDMLSALCHQGEGTECELPLCLIEDGQQVAYA